MSQHDVLLTERIHAVRTLDIYHAMRLNCSTGDFRRPGWAFSALSAEGDPTAILFDLRPVVRIIIPAVAADVIPGGTGLAAVAPELRVPVTRYLREHSPQQLCTPTCRLELDQIVRGAFVRIATSASDAYTQIHYTTPASFQPYTGQLQEWLEQLDDNAETDLIALRLLARYAGGVYVIRQQGAIASYAGIRLISPHVGQIYAETDARILRGNGLARAVGSRATKAVLADGRVPIAHALPEEPARRLLQALGYQVYAHSIEYYERTA